MRCLLTGGEDVGPAPATAPSATPASPTSSVERDDAEIALLEAARWRGRPVLAICRGVQVLNVAFGGTLIQDIPSDRPERAGARSRRLTGASRAYIPCASMRRAASASPLAPTSCSELLPSPGARPHRRRVPRVTATAPDGIVEGLEWREPGMVGRRRAVAPGRTRRAVGGGALLRLRRARPCPPRATSIRPARTLAASAPRRSPGASIVPASCAAGRAAYRSRD